MGGALGMQRIAEQFAENQGQYRYFLHMISGAKLEKVSVTLVKFNKSP